MSGILLVFYWHMTSVSFKSWVSYWVADVHLKSLCLESTASGRWHTWGSTWRWQWRLTHPTRPQLGPAKNGGKRRPSFTFWCAEKKCTRMNCLTHFGFHCTSNARICPSPQTTAGLRVCSVFVVQTPHSLKMSHITCIQSFYIVTHADHIMHIKSNMHLGQANVHTKRIIILLAEFSITIMNSYACKDTRLWCFWVIYQQQLPTGSGSTSPSPPEAPKVR